MALWVRFARDGGEGFGTLEGERIAVHAGDLFAGAAPTGESLALGDVRLLAPVRPGTFIGPAPSSAGTFTHVTFSRDGWVGCPAAS
jgi:hypothetical protein